MIQPDEPMLSPIYPYRVFHLIGIGGIGMSAIAQMLVQRGLRVSGSDVERTPMTRHVESLGIKIHRGHRGSHVQGSDCVIYSSSIQNDHAELVQAHRENISVKHRSEALAILSRDHWTQAVSGTHGKTTTTALLGRIYQEAGWNPTVVVGAKVPDLGGNVFLGSDQSMILEADESDASFLVYEPNSILITNIDRDHLDHFADLRAIYNTFKEFVGRLKKGGQWLGCKECPQVKRLLKEKPQKALSYGMGADCDFRAEDIQTRGRKGSRFILRGPKGLEGEIRLKLLGVHNILNALGAAEHARSRRAAPR